MQWPKYHQSTSQGSFNLTCAGTPYADKIRQATQAPPQTVALNNLPLLSPADLPFRPCNDTETAALHRRCHLGLYRASFGIESSCQVYSRFRRHDLGFYSRARHWKDVDEPIHPTEQVLIPQHCSTAIAIHHTSLFQIEHHKFAFVQVD